MSLKKLFLAVVSFVFILTACGNEQKEKKAEKNESKQEVVKDKKSKSKSKEKQVAFQYEIDPASFRVVPLADSDATEQAVLLTYDDAPDKYALDIAKALDKKGEKAMFLVNGMYLDEPNGEKMLKEIHKLGFEIGNHTYHHPDLTSLTYEQQREEIVGTSDRVEEITGKRPRFLRPPFGLYNEDTVRIANEENMTIMNWSYGYDWEVQYQDADALADIMVNTEFLGNGANLLMHDRSWTLKATPAIVDGLKAKGYEIVDPALIRSGQQEVKVSRGNANE